MNNGEWYCEFDDESGLWCLFHTTGDRAFASYCDRKECELEADKRNFRDHADDGR